MFKKIVLNFIVIFLISICAFKNVFAVEIKTEKVQVSNITIKANVPNDFDKNIMINFEFTDGTNALYTLNKQQGYIYKGLIQVGKAKLSFATVTPNSEAYHLTLPKEIDVKKDESINLNVSVNKVEGYKEPNKNKFTYDNNDYTKPIEDYGDRKNKANNVNNSVNNKRKDISKEEKSQDNKEKNQDNKEQENWFLRLIKDNLITLIITIVTIVVVIILKIKLN